MVNWLEKQCGNLKYAENTGRFILIDIVLLGYYCWGINMWKSILILKVGQVWAHVNYFICCCVILSINFYILYVDHIFLDGQY